MPGRESLQVHVGRTSRAWARLGVRMLQAPIRAVYLGLFRGIVAVHPGVSVSGG